MSLVGWDSLVGWNALEARVAALEDSVSALEAGEITVESAATFSALPDPAGLPDGRIGIALDSFANGQAAIWVVRAGAWVLPLESFPPTISFVVATSGGGTVLPQTFAVAAATDVALGTGWATVPAQTFARPADVAGVGALNPAALELGAKGVGLWRCAYQINYDSPAPGAAVLTQFVLQRSIGGGAFADVPGGELVRLSQDAPVPVNGISGVGLELNLSLLAGDRLRVVVRHDDAGSRNYTVRKFVGVLNQVASTPT